MHALHRTHTSNYDTPGGFRWTRARDDRLLRHPLRVRDRPEAAAAAILLNTVAPCCGSANLTAPSRRWLLDVPAALRAHRNLYLVLEGTMRSARCYTHEELPRQATYITILPFYRNCRQEVERGCHAEPTLPGLHDACYPHAPEGRLAGQQLPEGHEAAIGVPLGGELLPLDQWRGRRDDAQRTYLAFHYGGEHGRATALRRRLNKLVGLYQRRGLRTQAAGRGALGVGLSWLGKEAGFF